MNTTSSRGDRLAVVPARVGAQVDRPGLAARVDRPALGEIGHERAVRPVAHEAGEQQRDEVAVGLRPRRQRADRDAVRRRTPSTYGRATDAGACRGWTASGEAGGGGELEGRDADEAREDREQQDEGPDDEGVGSGHVSSVLGRRARTAAARRQAVVLGARMYDASEKMTNRASRTMVNCHSRRSTPRRLR